MSDPILPPVIRKLMSLDTPVAKRIFELMLMLLLMWGAGYMQEHGPGMAKFPAGLILVFSGIITMIMLFGLIVTIYATVGIDTARQMSEPVSQKPTSTSEQKAPQQK